MTALLTTLLASAALIITACVLVAWLARWRRRVLERRAWQERQDIAWWA